MNRPKLYYFDAPVSRGEECRLALHLAGVDFEDVRVKRDEWQALKPTTPYGSMPVLELPGRGTIAHSNAILLYVGREYDLHPKSAFEAALHEGMMCHVEDLRAAVSPTMWIADADEKKAAREKLASSYLPAWGAAAERQIGDGPFFAGEAMNVVDLKLYLAVRWFVGGHLDHIPATVFSDFPKLTRVHDAVRDDARIRAWYARG